jgi:hypothetical protein
MNNETVETVAGVVDVNTAQSSSRVQELLSIQRETSVSEIRSRFRGTSGAESKETFEKRVRVYETQELIRSAQVNSVQRNPLAVVPTPKKLNPDARATRRRSSVGRRSESLRGLAPTVPVTTDSVADYPIADGVGALPPPPSPPQGGTGVDECAPSPAWFFAAHAKSKALEQWTHNPMRTAAKPTRNIATQQASVSLIFESIDAAPDESLSFTTNNDLEQAIEIDHNDIVDVREDHDSEEEDDEGGEIEFDDDVDNDDEEEYAMMDRQAFADEAYLQSLCGQSSGSPVPPQRHHSHVAIVDAQPPEVGNDEDDLAKSTDDISSTIAEATISGQSTQVDHQYLSPSQSHQPNSTPSKSFSIAETPMKTSTTTLVTNVKETLTTNQAFSANQYNFIALTVIGVAVVVALLLRMLQ